MSAKLITRGVFLFSGNECSVDVRMGDYAVLSGNECYIFGVIMVDRK